VSALLRSRRPARPDDRGDLPGPGPADPLAGIGADPRQQLVEVGSRRNGEDGQYAIAVNAGQAAQALSAYRGPGVLQDRGAYLLALAFGQLLRLRELGQAAAPRPACRRRRLCLA
jgi:hypothetical protein